MPAVGGKRKQLDDDVDMIDKNKTPKPQFPAISPGRLTVRHYAHAVGFHPLCSKAKLR